MAETITVPRVSRPVEVSIETQRALAEDIYDLDDVLIDFNQPLVKNTDLVLLGTGTSIAYYRLSGLFSVTEDVDIACDQLAAGMPTTLGSGFNEAKVSNFRFRYERRADGSRADVLVGQVRRDEVVKERAHCLGVISRMATETACAPLMRPNKRFPQIKLAEVTHGRVSRDLEKRINEEIGVVTVGVSPGIVILKSVELTEIPA